jgi:hypothetical protein
MNNTDLQGFTQELQALRDKLSAMEAILQEAKEQEEDDPLRTFDVVLRVTTHASNWGGKVIDSDYMLGHFFDYVDEIAHVTHLTDLGDSIEVQGVTEVT